MDVRGGLWAWGHLALSFRKVEGRRLWAGPRIRTWGGRAEVLPLESREDTPEAATAHAKPWAASGTAARTSESLTGASIYSSPRTAQTPCRRRKSHSSKMLCSVGWGWGGDNPDQTIKGASLANDEL